MSATSARASGHTLFIGHDDGHHDPCGHLLYRKIASMSVLAAELNALGLVLSLQRLPCAHDALWNAFVSDFRDDCFVVSFSFSHLNVMSHAALTFPFGLKFSINSPDAFTSP